MGATESGRWQSWQLRWRMGAMSFVKVTSVVGAGACAVVLTVAVTSEASSRPKSPKTPGRRCLDITTSSDPTVSPSLGKTSVILTPGRLNTQLQAKERKSVHIVAILARCPCESAIDIGACSGKRECRDRGPGSDDDILSLVEHVGHRRATPDRGAGLVMPHVPSRARVESHEVAFVVASEYHG